jgi:hypothetical protein
VTRREQRITNLEWANEATQQRMGVLRAIEAGEMSISDALADPRAEGIKVYRLLIGQHRWGTRRVRQVLHAAGALLWPVAPVPISEERLVGGLTDRERTALVHAVHACSSKRKAA